MRRLCESYEFEGGEGGAGSVDEGRGVASAGEATSSEAEAIVWRCGPSAFFYEGP